MNITEIEKIHSKDTLYITFAKLKECMRDTLLYAKLPVNLLHRKLVKKIYNQGNLGRLDSLKEQIEEFFIDEGYSKTPLTPEEIEHLIMFINNQFHKTRFSDLSSVTEFIKLMSEFAKNKESINVKMQYLNWRLRVVEKTEFRHFVKISHNIRHQFSFYLNAGVDHKSMQRKLLMPILYIHFSI